MISARQIFLLLWPVLVACTPPAEVGSVGTSTSPFSAPHVIFEGERALELTQQCSRVSPGPVQRTWTPSASDIRAMEPALLELLQRELVAANWEADPTTYLRQYGGLVIGGRRVIYTHGFTLNEYNPSDVWRTQFYDICDGGPITFGVEYDPSSRGFSHFAFNGPYEAF